MAIPPNMTVMVNMSTSINDRIPAYDYSWLKDCSRHHLSPFVDLYIGCNDCCWVNYSPESKPQHPHPACDIMSSGVSCPRHTDAIHKHNLARPHLFNLLVSTHKRSTQVLNLFIFRKRRRADDLRDLRLGELQLDAFEQRDRVEIVLLETYRFKNMSGTQST